jgi:hypothetical protein
MAAVIAISLYSEIPRVAFQSQRHKEQLLMERGQQYMRAIQVYQQANKGQWPKNVDDIVTFQMRHFLRHKYIDPITGKDDWRLIHTNGMVLTDSLLTQNPAANKPAASSENTFISTYAGLGETLTGDQTQRPQDRRRPSEGGGAGGAGDLMPAMPGQGPDQSGQAPMPGTTPDQSGQPPLPGTTPDQSANPAAGNPAPGAQPGIPGMPGAPGMPGFPTQMPGQNGMGQGAAPGMPGLPGQAGNPALSMINQILTNPNPQAAQIAQQGQQGGILGGGVSGALQIGGGLAGVASKAAMEGIMVYNTQTQYKKWEFVFDPTKVPAIQGPGGGPAGSTPVSQMGSPQTQTPSGGMFGAMGQPGGIGQAAGMGQIGGMGQTGGMGQIGGVGQTGGMGQTGGFGQIGGVGAGAQGNNAAGGTSNTPAGMQTNGGAGAGSGALPPGFRLGRP